MRAFESTGSRLVRHDGEIAINTARATFAGWHDRLIAAIMLLAALAVGRSWFADRSWSVAAWTALGVGIVVGIGAGRLVAARLAFHSFDGLLAADALHPPARRRYMVAWHGVAIAVLAAILLIVRPSLLIIGVAAYLAGVLAAGLTDGVTMPRRMADGVRPVWTIRAWLQRPVAGFAAALILLLSLLPARTLGMNAAMAVVGIETLLLALTLTIVDDGIVRFMSIAGHGFRRILFHHAKGMTSFVAVTVPACWLALGPAAAGVVAGASIAMLLFMTLRLLAYRLHGKRLADLVVSIVAGLLMLVAYSMPVALPFLVLAIFWHLQRRGTARTWLLA